MSRMDLADVSDLMSEAHDIIELLGMAVRHVPDEEARAISAGVHVAIDRLTRAKEALQEIRFPSD